MSKPIFPTKYLTLFIWLLAIGIRVYGATTKAQAYDMGTFHAWGNHLLSVGPRHFFGSIWSDYLPFPILTFAPISWLSTLTHISFDLIFKLTYSGIELGLIYLLTRSVQNLPSWVTWILLLNPASFGDVAFWGQVDPIPSLLTVLSFTTVSPILFGLAVAYKPIMILTAPLFWYLSLKRGKHWWTAPLIASAVFFATAIPFVNSLPQVIPELYSRVIDQASTYPYLSINAWNLWSLVPTQLWINDSNTVLGLSGHTFGLFMFFTLTLIVLNRWRKQKFSQKYLYKIAATILILFYTFTTRMHERHLFFGLPFLALASATEPYLLIPFFLLSLAFTLNLYGAYYWVAHAQTWPFSQSFISLISWLTLFSSLSLAFIPNWQSLVPRFCSYIKQQKYLFLILVLASALRFIGLAHPDTYIFDEVYHAFTAREYLHNHVVAWEWWTTPPKGVAYEWTHPPLAKYGMVTGMLLFGENSFGWRSISATMGVLSVLGIYLLTFALFRRRNLALLASFLVAIEGLNISQSRIGMNDIYMLAFLIYSLFAAVKSRWKLASVLFGLSLASKWSALYGIVPLSLIYLNQHTLKNWNLKSSISHFLFSLRCLLIVSAVYILSFTPFILAGHTWEQFIELHRQMWYYHTHLVATHSYQSNPLQWIFGVRPVWYFVDYGQTMISNIYAQANPLILWLGLAAFVLQLKHYKSFPHVLAFVLYLIFTLPWAFSPRIMFFYHYLPSATFLCLILAAWILDLSPRSRLVTTTLCLLGLLLVSPMIFGFPTTLTYWNSLFTLIPSWK